MNEYQDVILQGAEGNSYEFRGKLLLSMQDKTQSQNQAVGREARLYRTDDGHYLFYFSYFDQDGKIAYPSIIRNASPRFIYSRAVHLLEDSLTPQSASFLKEMQKILKLPLKSKFRQGKDS